MGASHVRAVEDTDTVTVTAFWCTRCDVLLKIGEAVSVRAAAAVLPYMRCPSCLCGLVADPGEAWLAAERARRDAIEQRLRETAEQRYRDMVGPIRQPNCGIDACPNNAIGQHLVCVDHLRSTDDD